MAEGWQADGSYVPCPACGWTPPTERHFPPGRALHYSGVTHHGNCATVPRLSREQQVELQARLDDIHRCRVRAMAAAHNYWIG